MEFVFDSYQWEVIEAQEGVHLVLAPPGCGKTQILTERIRYAHEKMGVAYEDMLCLTFTNRAARGMKERIKQNINDPDINNLYVGNVHRFCSRFLFDNALIPAETGIIDDDDSISILARHLNNDENLVGTNYRLRRSYFDAIHLSAFMHQLEHEHPKEIRIHPECLSSEEIDILRSLCKQLRMPFSRETLLDIYYHPDTYETMLSSNDLIDMGLAKMAVPVLKKMDAALYYQRYKQENHLADFEDLLLLTYDALAGRREGEFQAVQGAIMPEANASGRGAASGTGAVRWAYPWVQVDEVQDLNPLQLKIIDLLSVDKIPNGNYVYLGDEQQAIFSFMGAKMSTLEQLKDRCKGNIHKLAKNHRSPKYLLQVFNYYAYYVLHIDRDMLPTSDSVPVRAGNELSVMSSNTLDTEYYDVTQQAFRLSTANPDETTAVIVTSNNDADIISSRMTDLGVKHFKVSGTDMFSLPDVKFLLAHLSVFANEHNFIAWARILKGMRVYEQSAASRRFVRELMNRALLPTDLLGDDSYVMNFASVCNDENKELIVFDTETTGLDVLEDDIVQIAAMKMKGGEVVAGSEFTVFIKTDREIPLKLGDIDNPIIEEMKHNALYSHEEALRMFVDYVGDGILLGHNADYDYNILDANLRRYLPEVDLKLKCPDYFDTLKLARLLEPDLHQYKLKHLLEVLHLEGENSHLADADVAATCNVVKHCLKKALEIIPEQKEFLAQKSVKERAATLKRNYQKYYALIRSELYAKQLNTSASVLTDTISRLYTLLKEENYIHDITGFHYLLKYVDQELVDKDTESTLKQQIANHVLEISTLKESDLCSGDVVDEKVFVTTIHKAKGLEFDNVIVFDVADDRYPGFYATDDPVQCAEEARKLYVAMTRAKKRLMISVGAMRRDYHGMPHNRNLSRFMTPVLRFFTTVSASGEIPQDNK